MRRRRGQARVSVLLTERALADLRVIESYSIREWGRKAATKYIDGVADVLDRLGANPDILGVEPEIAPNLCFYRFKKHVLVCDVTETTIVVLTVIHTSMDLPSRLLELEPTLRAEAEILHARLR